uniref:Uncharacterized protein n=1 Tax=Tanacetum cinerariifolium TaxID=118510 RepID=A0A6L2KXM1_TANCI|nr:hypothetical protein [Tanacetum cinerariifolium]
MRMVGKGFSRVETPPFKGMIVAQQPDDVADEGAAGIDVDVVPAAAAEPSIPSPTPTTQPPPPSQELPSTSQVIPTPPPSPIEDTSKQEEIIANIDADEDVTLKDVAAVEKMLRLKRMQMFREGTQTELKEVVTTAKLMTKLVTAASATITAATTPITAATIIVAPSAARRRKGVVIKNPKETATPSIIIHSKHKSKDKGKGIMVEEPKPQKNAEKRERRQCYDEMDYFKGMSYDDIRLIFKKYFNSNVAFLEKTKEQLEEEENKALKRKTESFEEKAAKKQKLDEEVEELKKHLQMVPNNDDVYTKAIPLALKMILLVERRYPLTRFTLDQMLNNVRLEVKEESEVSLELLRFVRKQQQEGFRPE